MEKTRKMYQESMKFVQENPSA
ncbi:hypothetical protein Gotri_019339 [Gossypium trilobum]|uniref:Uncharacterized protein n=1 Tax=Gossypium trilobum TaxID=34281 RepID=A0A7J9ECI6_9ROSI|nr:hypothetical protein [Gossypium trilobum]